MFSVTFDVFRVFAGIGVVEIRRGWWFRGVLVKDTIINLGVF